MALTRQKKEARVAEATDALTGATSVVFMTYDALKLADMNELRDQLHAEGIAMRVIPKRLLSIALKASGLTFDPALHQGQMALVWGDDVTAPARVVAHFAAAHQQIQLVSGVMEHDVINAQAVAMLASLPDRPELLAQLVRVIAGPLSGFQRVLAGVPRQAVYVLKAIAEAKGT